MPSFIPETKMVAVDRDGRYIELGNGGSRFVEVLKTQDLTKPIKDWAVYERYEIGYDLACNAVLLKQE